MRLRLFGSVELSVGDEAEQRLVPVQPKRAAVLAYLAAARPGPMHRRDTLLSLFWPESSDEQARSSLSKTLHYLRERLGSEALGRHGDDEVGLSREIVWCDVTAFEGAAERGDLEEALSLYSGHFLEGFHVDAAPDFEHWVHARRKQLRLRACELAWNLSDATAASGDRAAAERWGRTAVRWAPEDEAGFRRLLMLLQLDGNRASAIQAYEDFASRLSDDYGIEPSDPTRELIAAIREGSLESGPLDTGADRAVGPSAVAAPLKSSPDPDRGARDFEPALGEQGVEGPMGGTPRNTTRRRAFVWAAALAVVGVTYSALVDPVADSELEEAAVTPSIAVLPFDNYSDDVDRSYIANGLTAEITGRLEGIEALRVMSRTVSVQLVAAGGTLQEVAEALDVGSVLEGSVSQVGDELRISAQLTDVGTSEVLWSGDYEGVVADVFDIQRSVALQIADALDATLSPDETRRLVTPPTRNVAAYELNLQAIAAVQVRNADGHREAIAFLQQAIALDSTFVAAMASLGVLYSDLYEWTGEAQDADSAEVMSRRALALDGTFSRAWWALGRTFYAQGRLSDSRRTFQDGQAATNVLGGLALDLSGLETDLGNLDDGLYWAERVLMNAPDGGGSNVHYHVGFPLLALGDDERTQRFLDESLAKFPDFREAPNVARLHGLYAELDLSRGRFDEAMRRLRDRASAYPGHTGILEDLAWGAYLTGAEDAREIVERLYDGAPIEDDAMYAVLLLQAGQEARGRRMLDEAWRSAYEAYEDGIEGPDLPRGLAAISAARGQTEEALVWLERAYQSGFRDPTSLRLDPVFDSMREDEGFVQLIARIEADREQMRQAAFGREGSMFRESVGGR